MADEYATGAYTWWHLSRPSPELIAALDDGWLTPPGRVLDIGCGLGSDAAHVGSVGFESYGIDISHAALATACKRHPHLLLTRADVRSLPFETAAFDFLLDRGTFHYLNADDRNRYVVEAGRVLRPGGRLLLRACLRSEGMKNDINAEVIRYSFAAWQMSSLVVEEIPSDTRSMPALVARLERLTIV